MRLLAKVVESGTGQIVLEPIILDHQIDEEINHLKPNEIYTIDINKDRVSLHVSDRTQTMRRKYYVMRDKLDSHFEAYSRKETHQSLRAYYFPTKYERSGGAVIAFKADIDNLEAEEIGPILDRIREDYPEVEFES